MTGVAAEQPDVFDLDSFAPKPVHFKLRGVVYKLPGDPPVETVQRMLRLEQALKATDDSGELESALSEARDMLLDLLEGERQAAGVDLDAFYHRVGVGEVLALFGLMTGGPSVAQAVAEAITSNMAGNGAGEPGEAPLASAPRSAARSSRRAPSSRRSRTTTRG